MTDSARHYFVDEAGDLTLFNRRGRVIVGTPGVSRTFMVGVAWIPNPNAVREHLASLRAELLADAYFRGVPSMQPRAGKTASFFHAKDDLPEVRREVFRLLPTFGAKVVAAIRRKRVLVENARHLRGSPVPWKPDSVYDDLVKRLFKDLLHKADSHRIIFARRGKRDRQAAFRAAIDGARRNFALAHGVTCDRPVDLVCSVPSEVAGLQVIDYYLWALQRLYERGEDRYFELLKPQFRLIMDLDDKRRREYGRWYSDGDTLSLEKLMPVVS